VEEYGGVRAVAEMFNRMERNVGRQVLEKIESINPDLAASIRDLMFVFDDILLIDDQGISEILKRVDRKALSYALKGTSEELQAQIFRNMSSRAVEMLKEEMEYLGAVKLKEVEKAQHQIVEVVRQLEEEGIITIGGAGGGEEYVT
jgi:flagellar motor switch protein FliG